MHPKNRRLEMFDVYLSSEFEAWKDHACSLALWRKSKQRKFKAPTMRSLAFWPVIDHFLFGNLLSVWIHIGLVDIAKSRQKVTQWTLSSLVGSCGL